MVLFTGTIPHKRAEFFYDSREVFENLFFINFTPEDASSADGPARTTYSVFTSTDVLKELEYIGMRVSRVEVLRMS